MPQNYSNGVGVLLLTRTDSNHQRSHRSEAVVLVVASSVVLHHRRIDGRVPSVVVAVAEVREMTDKSLPGGEWGRVAQWILRPASPLVSTSGRNGVQTDANE